MDGAECLCPDHSGGKVGCIAWAFRKNNARTGAPCGTQPGLLLFAAGQDGRAAHARERPSVGTTRFFEGSRA